MNKKIAYVGLDVHKNSITIALFVEQRKEEEWIKKIAHNKKTLLSLLKESQKTIFKSMLRSQRHSIFRKLNMNGIDCIVVAPSLIPTDNRKIKTDKIDAKN